MSTILGLIAFLVVINLATGLAFWRDKVAARTGRRRVSERSLLALAFFGGSPGALVAQRFLRHKTHKQPFRTYLTAVAILHLILVLALIAAVYGAL